ncbi:MAG: DUF2189 domain-containing protein [Rubrivivax sp.]
MSAAPFRPPATPVQVRAVGLDRPWHWLKAGLLDLIHAPLPGLLHGALAALFGGVLLWWAHDRFWLIAGTFSGFLVMAPLLATGLYAVSRARERGRPASLGIALRAWNPRRARLVGFGLLLALAGTGWVLTSAALITSFAPAPVRGPMDFVRHVLLAPSSWLFEAWLLLGGVLAAPVFASSVLAIPLLLDRDVTIRDAVLASWRAVLESPVALALWAVLILVLTAIGMATALTGLVVILPWLAHASWHAYRDLAAPAADPAPPASAS